ncbi:MAG TPA: alpha/beta fold hydrolase [Acetobacteraceae bacterium]|nr:alpha/beta fold hydrolase [Acetobacteraceae bacterium]
MSTSLSMLPSLSELADFGARAANAAALLAEMRDKDVDLALTPREEVGRIGGKTLYRILPRREPVIPTPVLVVYAMVGRWTVLDLQEDRSFLRNLSEHGSEVYVLDWGHPSQADRYDDFADLTDLYMDGFIDTICDRHRIDKVNLLGICQGGVLSLCYAALHPERVRNLITCVTPVDFHADKAEERLNRGFMNVWTRNLSPEDIDLLVDTMGNVPGEVGGAMFSLMTPLRTLAKYNLTLLEVGQDRAALANFLRMEKWLADRPAHPGEAARQWLKDLYQRNLLAKNELLVGGRRVDLKSVTMPVLNIYSETDHIIPAPASRAMGDRLGSKDYTAQAVPGGHIGMFCSRNQSKLQTLLTEWLKAR